MLAAGALAATLSDIRSRRIPNTLTATMAGLGVGLAAGGVSGVSFGASMAGFVIGLALMMPGHLLGATGAGDVKLMAAVGAIVGPGMTVTAFLFTAVAGGVLAVAVATPPPALDGDAGRTGRLVTAPSVAGKQIRSAGSSSRFAYGPAIAVGSVLAALVG